MGPMGSIEVPRRRMVPLAALVAAVAVQLAAAVSPTALAAQDVRAGIVADTVRVGDVVPVAVRVVVERGERVIWPETLPVGGEGAPVENAASVRERVDTLADGRLQVTAIYSVTPWRTGEAALPELPVQIVSGDEGVRTLTASLPALDVLSVLPADTAGIEPKPIKGVIGPDRLWWPLLLLLLALILAIAAVLWWLHRRRSRVGPAMIEPALSPREAAMAALGSAREAGLLERGDMREFYSRISDAVRGYAAALDPEWSEHLTTTEILGRFRAGPGIDEARELGGLLRAADQVKFARRRPDPDTALAEWEAARAWVLRFEKPRPPASLGEAA